MKKLTSALIAAASVLSIGAGANPPIARPTEKCTTGWTQSIFAEFDLASTLASHIVDAMRNPAENPDLEFLLWNPVSVQDILLTSFGTRMLVFNYAMPQDVVQILNSLEKYKGPAEVRFMGVNGGLCFATSPPPRIMTVTEYYNAGLGHYLLSTTEQENQFVDRGEWGPGWIRTGESFQTYAPSACSGQANPVHRHYGSNTNGPPSLFYTPKGEECGYLQNHDVGWTYLDTTFGAYLPVNGGCTGTQKSVFRLYNNRWMFNDSNHRYTTKPAIYETMQQQGWVGEGVAFCLP